MNNPSNTRKVLIIASAVDALLGGIVLLIYFGFLPVDISSWGISRGVVGIVGELWFAAALAVLVYQLTKTE